MTLDTVRAEYNTGKSFVYDTPDVYGRPVMIITASKHNIGARHAPQLLRCVRSGLQVSSSWQLVASITSCGLPARAQTVWLHRAVHSQIESGGMQLESGGAHSLPSWCRVRQ